MRSFWLIYSVIHSFIHSIVHCWTKRQEMARRKKMDANFQLCFLSCASKRSVEYKKYQHEHVIEWRKHKHIHTFCLSLASEKIPGNVLSESSYMQTSFIVYHSQSFISLVNPESVKHFSQRLFINFTQDTHTHHQHQGLWYTLKKHEGHIIDRINNFFKNWFFLWSQNIAKATTTKWWLEGAIFLLALMGQCT